MKVLSQDGLSAFLYLHPEPPKYKVGLLVAITRPSVAKQMRV